MNTLAVCLGVSFALNVLLTVLVFRQSAIFADKLDQSHRRTTQYTKELIDRIIHWDQYHLIREEEEAVRPDEPEAVEPVLEPVLGPDRGGFGSRLGLRGWSPEEVEAEFEREAQ